MNYIATIISNRSNGYIPRTVNVYGDTPFSQKMMEGISSQVCILSR